MNYFIEVRPALKRNSAPRLVPLAERYAFTGFTSLYAFDEETKKFIEDQRSTANLGDREVYSDTLFIDFDGIAQEKIVDFEVKLAGLAFDVYHSGGRSIHYHIPVVPTTGRDVHRQQKLWVAAQTDFADLSIYKKCGIYRLPGTYHNKYPGQKKTLLYRKDGDILNIERQELPTNYMAAEAPEDDNDKLTNLLFLTVHEGNRNNMAFLVGKTSQKCGNNYWKTKELLELWNRHNVLPSLPGMELQTILETLYR